jgi:hypothetical protein
MSHSGSSPAPGSAVPDPFGHLANVLRGLTSALVPAQIVEVVAERGLGALGATGAALAISSVDGTLAVHVAGSGPRDELTSIWLFDPDRDGPLATSATEPSTLWFASPIEARRTFPGLPTAIRGSGVVLSLVADGEVIGALGVYFAEPRALSADERDYLEGLANAAAVALLGCLSMIGAPSRRTGAGETASISFVRRVLTRQFGVSRSLAAVIDRHRLSGDLRQDVVSVIDDLDDFGRSLRKRIDEGGRTE